MFVAGAWAALAASALVVGALITRWLHPGARVIAIVMALGSGVLIASVAYDLVDVARGVTDAVVTGLMLLLGALVFVLGARIIERGGGRHRKRPEHDHSADEGSAKAIALGSVLDGIPESLVLGLTVLQGALSVPLLAGVALSNLPESMASSSGMLRSGWPMRRIMALWIGVVVASAVSAGAGYALLGSASPLVAAMAQLFAGGALIAMIVDTMIPEAYAIERDWTGLLVVVGFVATLTIEGV